MLYMQRGWLLPEREGLFRVGDQGVTLGKQTSGASRDKCLVAGVSSIPGVRTTSLLTSQISQVLSQPSPCPLG